MRCSLNCNDRIEEYVRTWKRRGYPLDIPDEVPDELMRLGLAPSYKAIACALLKNDLALHSLGFTSPVSPYYGALKRIEIAARPKQQPAQMDLFDAA